MMAHIRNWLGLLRGGAAITRCLGHDENLLQTFFCVNRGVYRLRMFLESQDLPEAGKKLGKVNFIIFCTFITFHHFPFQCWKTTKTSSANADFFLSPPVFFPPKNHSNWWLWPQGLVMTRRQKAQFAQRAQRAKTAKKRLMVTGWWQMSKKPVDPVYVVKIYKGLYYRVVWEL